MLEAMKRREIEDSLEDGSGGSSPPPPLPHSLPPQTLPSPPTFPPLRSTPTLDN